MPQIPAAAGLGLTENKLDPRRWQNAEILCAMPVCGVHC